MATETRVVNEKQSFPEVTEGGEAPAPTEGKGKPKAATSSAHDNGALDDNTSQATAGKAEKAAAALSGGQKPQHGRGHRKED